MDHSILAVDDELHMLRLLEQLISKKTPYRIVTTHNALEVPGLLEKQRFDVIITDLRMPGLSGMDILRLVRDGNRSEEIIMITAFGTLESASEALALGVSDYITKPFKKERLLWAIERAMKHTRAGRNEAILTELLQGRPYTDAERRFKEAYVKYLSIGAAGDRRLMADQSGISPEEIESIMPDEET